MPAVLVTGAFDDLRARQARFLHEASRLGEAAVLLWTDEAVRSASGSPPRFVMAERLYLVSSLRFVKQVIPVSEPCARQALPGFRPPVAATVCFDPGGPAVEVNAARALAAAQGRALRAISDAELQGFPDLEASAPDPGKRRVVVTGCFDWLHSGHVRFFEEVAAHGELYVVVGSDANVRLLKGSGHPRFSQEQRRYMVGSVRYVHQALVSTGSGWMDAEPEILSIGADVYAVNEDGDKPEKRQFCADRGVEYLVLRRVPAPGLPPRSSTELRGF